MHACVFVRLTVVQCNDATVGSGAGVAGGGGSSATGATETGPRRYKSMPADAKLVLTPQSSASTPTPPTAARNATRHDTTNDEAGVS